MDLPDDVIYLVREFSRPITRPDWRTIQRVNEHALHWNILALFNTKRIPVIERFVLSYHEDASYMPNYTYMFRSGFVVNIYKN